MQERCRHLDFAILGAGGDHLRVSGDSQSDDCTVVHHESVLRLVLQILLELSCQEVPDLQAANLSPTVQSRSKLYVRMSSSAALSTVSLSGLNADTATRIQGIDISTPTSLLLNAIRDYGRHAQRLQPYLYQAINTPGDKVMAIRRESGNFWVDLASKFDGAIQLHTHSASRIESRTAVLLISISSHQEPMFVRLDGLQIFLRNYQAWGREGTC